MSQRFRITVRGDNMELRGFAEHDHLASFADAMKPYGLVIASPMEGVPFEGQPTLEKSIDVVSTTMTGQPDLVSAVEAVATLHYGQAMVIRGERDAREEAERQMHVLDERHEATLRMMHERELHHFETEQIIDRVRGVIDAEIGWENPAVLIDRIRWALGETDE